VLKSRTSWTQV